MRALAVVVILLLPAAGSAQPAPAGAEPSVLVQTQAARQGSLPRMLTAYGSIQPSADGGSESLSLLRPGQIVRMTAFVGQQVSRGQPLLTVSADPAAVAAFRQAGTALSLAQGERSRTAQALAQHLATRDQLAQAEKAAADAQASLDALNRAGGGSMEQVLTAPFDGVVAAVPVAAGSRIVAGAPLVTVVRSGRFVAAIGVEASQRGQLAVGQPARVEPLDGGPVIAGSVLSVGGMLDPQTRLLPVLLAMPPGGSDASGLLPGSPVRASVQISEMKGWLAPRNAVMTDAGGPYLFQVSGETAVRVNVRVVGMAGDTTVVDGPLDTRRGVVVSGNTQLQDGGAVRQVPPAPGAVAAVKP